MFNSFPQEKSDFLKAFLLLCVPYLLAFSLASRRNLRVWIALQRAPVPLIGFEQASTSKTQRRLVGLAIVALYILFFESLFVVKNKDVKDALYGVVAVGIASSLIIITYEFASDLLRLPKRSIHRKGDGSFVFQNAGTPNQKKKIISTQIFLYLLGGCISVATLWKGYPLLIAVISLFISYYGVRSVHVARLSFRGILFVYLAFLGIDLLTTTFIILISRNFSGKNIPGADPGIPKGFWEEMVERCTWFFSPILSWLPGLVISLVIRFDYQRHLDNLDVPSDFVLHTVSAPSSELGEGVMIPSKAPKDFKKPYYATAITSWALVHSALIVVTLCVSGSLSSAMTAGLGGFLLELPIIMVALIIVAIMRGELNVLWTYREEWIIKKGEGMTLS